MEITIFTDKYVCVEVVKPDGQRIKQRVRRETVVSIDSTVNLWEQNKTKRNKGEAFPNCVKSYSLIGGGLAVWHGDQALLQLATYDLPCAMGYSWKKNKKEI